MGKHITDPQAGFLRMMANRVVRLAKQADESAERFHAMKHRVKVANGHEVHLRFDGPVPVVEVWPGEPNFNEPELTELASEIICKPAKLVAKVSDHLEFRPNE